MSNYKTYEECENVKEYLNQTLNIDRSINAKMDKITYYRNLATKATSSFSAEKISGTPRRSRVEDCVCKIIELEEAVNADIDSLVRLKAELEEIIGKIERGEYKQLMELRYICGKTWAQVAEDMNYSIVTIWRLHGNILREIRKIRG